MYKEKRHTLVLRYLVSLLVVFVVVFVYVSSNPLRGSEAEIEILVLEKTPMGSSFDHVLRSIDESKWELSSQSRAHGFYDGRSKPRKTTGFMSIRASLGDYQDIPFQANVTVFWGFSEVGELSDIWVWKTWNGL